LPNIQSAIKRAKQNHKLRQHNASMRSMMRTSLKTTITTIEAGNKEQAQIAFTKTQIALDKAVSKRLIHKNKAARHKRRLSDKIKALAES